MADPIIKELDALALRARTKFIEAKPEFAQNCYPMMKLLYETLMERIDEIEEVVYTDNTSTIQPQLSAEILGVFELALQFNEAVKLAGYPNDILAQLGATLERAIPQVAHVVNECTLVEESEPGEEEEDDQEEDEDDDEPTQAAASPPPSAAPASAESDEVSDG